MICERIKNPLRQGFPFISAIIPTMQHQREKEWVRTHVLNNVSEALTNVFLVITIPFKYYFLMRVSSTERLMMQAINVVVVHNFSKILGL